MLTESWVEGKRVEENDAQPSKIDSRIWVNFTRNGLRLRSRHQEPPHTDVSRNLATVVVRGVLPDLRRKITGLLPSGPKSSFQTSKFCISFGNQGLRVWRKGGEAHSPSCLKSSVKFPQSVMIWVQCHLLVLVHCVFWKPTSLHPFIKKLWSTSHFLLLTSFLKMLISFSNRIWHLPTLPKAPKVG